MDTSQLGPALDRAECLRLSTTVGRLIYTSGALPAVEPVRFVLEEQTVVFRSTYAETIEWQGESPVVAFQADQLDPSTAVGWSVTGIGRARILDATEAAGYCPTQVPSLVRTADGHHVIAMELQLFHGVTTD